MRRGGGRHRRPRRLAWALLVATALAQAGLAPVAGPQADPPAPWRYEGLPNQKLPPTQYEVVELEGERVLRIRAEASYGNLVHPVTGADAPPGILAWRWRLEQPLAAADLRTKAGDDAALKVCALFDLPLDALPFWERQQMRLARTLSGRHLPAATLCYVWDARLPPGTVLPNAHSPRLRWLVLRGPESAPGQWLAERRDLGADFLRAFGDEAARVPPLLAIGVGADADNTGGRSLAYVAALTLER